MRLTYVIKSNSDYLSYSSKHHLNYAPVLNWEYELPPQIGCTIGTSLPSIESAFSSNFGGVSKEVSHPKRDLESKLK